MKTKILALFILLVTLTTSCNYSESDKDGESFSPSSGLNLNHVIVVDGCEYFVVNAYTSYTYVHKGNCINPIHYQQNVIQNTPIHFYDFESDNYLGYIPTDSIVVNFKEKKISCFYQGKIAYMTKLAEMGMTTMDKRK